MNQASGPEGRIEVRLRCRAGRVQAAEVRSSRPRAAEQLFAGQPVDRVLQTVPMLFSVCATAQGCAAVAATEAALGLVPDRAHRAARELLVLFETAREHLWRILLDWPVVVDRDPDAEALAASTRLFKELSTVLYPHHSVFLPGGGMLHVAQGELHFRIGALGRLLERSVLGVPMRTWQSFADGEALARWSAETDTPAAALLGRVLARGWANLGRCGVTPLPALADSVLDERLQTDPGFTTAPLWEGEPRETGAYARQRRRPLVAALSERHGNGLLPRLVARLCELAALPGRAARLVPLLNHHGGEAPASVTGSGAGLAQVEAARGSLAHRLEIDDGRITRYQLLAPTEWNFHPRGVLAEGLRGLPADEALESRSRLLLQAVDPCVGWRLEVDHDA